MSRRAQENIVAAVLLAVFAGVIWLCQDFGPRARMIPLPLAIFGILLTVIQIAWQNLRSTDELHMELISVNAPAVSAQPAAGIAGAAAGRRVTWREEGIAMAIVAALLGLVLTFGIVPAVFLFTGGYFVLTRQYSWTASLLYTSCLTAAIYLLFMVALQIQPYHGLIAPLVEKLG
jgi:hypothetical protein